MTIDKKDIIRVAIGLGVGLAIALLYFTFNPNVKLVDKPVIGMKTVEKVVPKIQIDTFRMYKKIEKVDTLIQIDSSAVRRLIKSIDSLELCLDKANINIKLTVDTVINNGDDTVSLVVNKTKNTLDKLYINRKPIKIQTEVQFVPTPIQEKWYENKWFWFGLGIVGGGIIGHNL